MKLKSSSKSVPKKLQHMYIPIWIESLIEKQWKRKVVTQESESINSKPGGATRLASLVYLPPIFFLLFVLHKTLLPCGKFIKGHRDGNFFSISHSLPLKNKWWRHNLLGLVWTKIWGEVKKKKFQKIVSFCLGMCRIIIIHWKILNSTILSHLEPWYSYIVHS